MAEHDARGTVTGVAVQRQALDAHAVTGGRCEQRGLVRPTWQEDELMEPAGGRRWLQSGSAGERPRSSVSRRRPSRATRGVPVTERQLRWAVLGSMAPSTS
jgi:hypothetical protein